MSSQVVGEPEGTTLVEAIDAGRVETPGELSFPQWQRWRKGPGKRPTVRRDGRGLSTKGEVDLWRAVMVHLYGAGKAEALPEEDEEEEQELVPAYSPSVAATPASPGSVRSEAGGGDNSPRPPSVGSVGASVSSLKGCLDALYDPSAEEFGAYLARIGRVINALRSLDASVPPGMLKKTTRKAELMIEL